MEGRAAPITSSSRLRTSAAMVSGFVNRPTPSKGVSVTCRTSWVHFSS